MRFPSSDKETKNIAVIINELLEALSLQELALAHLLNAEVLFIEKITTEFSHFLNTKNKLDLDIYLNHIVLSLSDHQKWIYRNIRTIKELKKWGLKNKNLKQETIEMNFEDFSSTEILEQTENNDEGDFMEDLSDEELTEIIDQLDDLETILNERDDNDDGES